MLSSKIVLHKNLLEIKFLSMDTANLAGTDEGNMTVGGNYCEG
jgi:hypothetical protein